MVTGWDVAAEVVDRPALRDVIDGSARHPLTLLVAQAGAGKTVLLSQWARQHPELGFVWLDIDPRDNEAAHLARRIVAQLDTISEDTAHLALLAESARRSLGAPFLDALVEQLRGLGPSAIVFDDLHLLSNRALIDDVMSLVDRLPEQVRLIIATRVDLPLGWVRRRLRGDVAELRTADLAFDTADAAALLGAIAGRPISERNVELLVARTEGWAAGLQLAGLTLRNRDDDDEFVGQFGGTDRLVTDYLGEEVLNAQSGERRTRLLIASALDEINADLLTTITGDGELRPFLEDVERESLFLVPLDSRRERFRFHHLFRDLLRYRLRAEAPDVERSLLRRAAHWHLERDETDRAVEYLLRARDWEAALDVIRTRGAEIYERSEMREVIRWIGELPPRIVPERIDITLLLGVLRSLEGQLPVADGLLRQVIVNPQATAGQRMVAETILAARAQWSAHPEVSAEMARRAIAHLEGQPDVTPPDILGLTDRDSLMTLALLSEGRSCFLDGRPQQARRWLEKALASEGSRFVPWRVSTLGSLALIHAWLGRTTAAEELADEAIILAEESGLGEHPTTADAHLARALDAAERAETHRAADALREGITLADSNGRIQLLWIGHVIQARLQELNGDAAATPPLATPPGPPPALVRDRMFAARARARRLTRESDHATTETVDGGDGPAVRFERAATALTRLRPDAARPIVLAATSAHAPDAVIESVEGRILRAWLAELEGRTAASEAHLRAALELASGEQLIDPFLRAGPVVTNLLRRLPGPRDAHAQRILDCANDLIAAPSTAIAEPLTQRELEILALLPTRATNTELAERFFVSVNTIKTHTVHIYRKLDVPNRSAAILRAREVGLLP